MSETYVVIPAFRPAETLPELVRTICDRGYRAIVVDDGGGAPDKALFDALDPRAVVLRHDVNRGKGAALKTGLAYIRSQLADKTGGSTAETGIVAFMDADGQESPDDLDAVLAAARSEEGRYRLSIGVCAFEKKKYLPARIGHAVTCGIFRLLIGTKLSHAFTGLRACSASFIDRLLEIEGDRYEYDTNVMAHFARHEAGLCQIPIRDGEVRPQKNFRVIRDSLRVYGSLFRFAGSSVTSYLVEYLTFCLFSALLADPLPLIGDAVANVIGCVVGGAANYLINCLLVFKRKPSFRSASQFAGLTCVTLSLKTLALYLWKFTPVPDMLCKLLADVSMFFVNYLIQQKLIFRKREKKN